MSLLAGRDESALQGVIHADGGVRWREGPAGEYAILMTSADHSLEAMGSAARRSGRWREQLEELKNRWG
ncbi:MAG: hypothetical protein V5B31_03580 [Candidatus Accumulibacter propinquus]|jgi:hypothetical protein|uniref:hypothetical protein n=1 Tax=Candidatus Accumulibacter propinquus TaxID=2954380 RepID=UPI002FC2C891